MHGHAYHSRFGAGHLLSHSLLKYLFRCLRLRYSITNKSYIRANTAMSNLPCSGSKLCRINRKWAASLMLAVEMIAIPPRRPAFASSGEPKGSNKVLNVSEDSENKWNYVIKAPKWQLRLNASVQCRRSELTKQREKKPGTVSQDANLQSLFTMTLEKSKSQYNSATWWPTCFHRRYFDDLTNDDAIGERLARQSYV